MRKNKRSKRMGGVVNEGVPAVANVLIRGGREYNYRYGMNGSYAKWDELTTGMWMRR